VDLSLHCPRLKISHWKGHGLKSQVRRMSPVQRAAGDDKRGSRFTGVLYGDKS
jgi:hypothetical protein